MSEKIQFEHLFRMVKKCLNFLSNYSSPAFDVLLNIKQKISLICPVFFKYFTMVYLGEKTPRSVSGINEFTWGFAKFV
jgi:hypothetical protein